MVTVDDAVEVALVAVFDGVDDAELEAVVDNELETVVLTVVTEQSRNSPDTLLSIKAFSCATMLTQVAKSSVWTKPEVSKSSTPAVDGKPFS